MWDQVWELPTEGRFDDAADEARYLGNMYAAQVNRWMSGIPIGRKERNRCEYADSRLASLVLEHGDSVEAAYNEGYDETDDPTLNDDLATDRRVRRHGHLRRPRPRESAR